MKNSSIIHVPSLFDTTDDVLYNIYNLGWNDCPDGNDRSNEFKGIHRIAYNHGWFHYIAGDDQMSIDYLTREEILEQIKELNKKR